VGPGGLDQAMPVVQQQDFGICLSGLVARHQDLLAELRGTTFSPNALRGTRCPGAVKCLPPSLEALPAEV
jgi:hypothetical protein